MNGALLLGQLTGDGGIASCQVKIDADGAPYIQDVSPLLPEGQYRLSVKGLYFDVCFAKGEWLSAGD